MLNPVNRNTTCVKKIIYFCRNMVSWKGYYIALWCGTCQVSHLTGFSRDIALVHWILHFLTWILHIKRLFLIEKHATYGTGILFSWRDTISFPRKLRFFQNKMLHLWKDFFIMCRGIVCWKNIAFFQKKCNLYNETCFFTSWGYFIVAFNIAFYNKNAQKWFPFKGKLDFLRTPNIL